MNINDREISVDELDQIMHPTSLPRIGSARAERQASPETSDRALEPSDSHGRAADHAVWTMEELEVQDVPRSEPSRLNKDVILKGLQDVITASTEVGFSNIDNAPVVEICACISKLATMVYAVVDRG